MTNKEKIEKAQKEIIDVVQKYNCMLVPYLLISEYGTKAEIRIISKDEAESGPENKK